MNYSIVELVQTSVPTFQNIDMRVAATRHDERWIGDILVIRLSDESPARAMEHLRKLEAAEEGVVETDDFWIGLDAVPFSTWPKIFEQLTAGAIIINSRSIQLRDPIDLEKPRFQSFLPSWEVRPFDATEWPGVVCTSSPYPVPIFGADLLVRKVSARWHGHPYEIVNRLCEVNVGQLQGHGCQFYLSVPVFARVSKIEYLPEEKKLEATVFCHKRMANELEAVAMVRGPQSSTPEPWRRKLRLAAVASDPGPEELQTTKMAAPIEEQSGDDNIQVRLIHPKLSVVHDYSGWIRDLIPIAIRNNLFQALKRFCPENELGQAASPVDQL